MKTFKIEIPQGYEIDKEKSTFENIVFKESKKELPKMWKELKIINGYYVSECGGGVTNKIISVCDKAKYIFATKEQAEASIALAQLSQLIAVYRNGWVPDWSDGAQDKYCIEFYVNKIYRYTYTETSQFLSFQDEETRDLFLENFRDLIEKAKPLMS